MAKESVYQAWLESGPTPMLILSSVVVDRSAPAELVFYVTREVVKVAMGCVLPLKFSSTDLKQLLSILASMEQAEGDPLVALPPTASQYLDAIKRHTPPEVLQAVGPLIRRFAMEPRAHDLDRWLTGVNRTADRVGLLMCGDLNAALSVLTRFSEAAGGREMAFVPDRASLLTSDADLLDLFRFAFSEPFFQLRKKLGVTVGATSA